MKGRNCMKWDSKIKFIILCALILFTSTKIELIARTQLDGSAIDSANYICNNLEEVNEYVIEHGGMGRISYCIIQKITIEGFNEKTKGVYIDFDGLNGFMTLGPNFIVYDYSFEGKSIIEDGLKDKLVFNILDGYTFKGIETETLPKDTEMYGGYIGYDGVADDGTIEYLDDYVEDRYGTGYNIYKSENASTRNGALQLDLSVYIKLGDGFISSEGNCGLVSAYNLLMHYRYDRYYAGLPYGYTYRYYNPSIEERDLYLDKRAEGIYRIYDTNIGDYGVQRRFSYLYIEARLEANDINGSPESLTVYESRDILNNVMENNNYTTRFKVIEIWSMNVVTSRIDNGEGILWSTINSAYGNHTMFVAGYDIYLKETRFLFFTIKTYKNFFELRDGHNEEARYYDFNGLNGGTTLGFFVVKK